MTEDQEKLQVLAQMAEQEAKEEVLPKPTLTIGHVRLAVIQKFANIAGYEKVLDQIPEDIIRQETKVLYRHGYLTRVWNGPTQYRVSSLGEQILKVAMRHNEEAIK